MTENNICPCCGRHCDLTKPHCDRGSAYLRTGVIPECKREQSKFSNVSCTANYNAMDTDNKLIINLRDLGHMIRFLFEGKGSQKRILIILHETGGMTQRELTERIGIQPGSASEVIGKLENAGLIQRTLSQSDRRTADIRLTEAGQLQAEEAIRQRKKRHQEMFSCLSEEEKQTLLTLTEKINTDWDSRYRNNERDAGYSEPQEKNCDLHKQHSHHNGFHRH